MYTIRKVCLLTALRSLQTAEYLLEGLIQTRSYLPFAVLSLLGGFLIGFLITYFS
jgi:hypothetical protein